MLPAPRTRMAHDQSVASGRSHVPWIVVAALGLSVAGFVHGLGMSNVVALPLVLAATLPVAVIALRPQSPIGSVALSGVWVPLALVAQYVALLLYVVDGLRHAGPAAQLVGGLAALGLGVSGWRLVRRPGGQRRTDWVPAVLFLGVAVTWIAITPDARIDVLVYQTLGGERFVEGTNPYLPGYPDIYTPEASARFFGPGLSIDGVLQFGFPYPGPSLLLSTAGTVVGDPRYAHAAASAIAGGLLTNVRGGGAGPRTASFLFLSSPALLYVITFGWTEPFLVVALVAWLVSRDRASRWSALLLGVFVGMKQYSVVLLPPLLGRPAMEGTSQWMRRALVAVVAAVLLSLPFYLWDPGAFLRSVVFLQFSQPLRPDGISVLAVLARAGAPMSPAAAGVVSAVATVGTAALVVATDDGTMCRRVAGLTLVMLIFLLTSKQAFVNYYIVALAGMASYVATTQPEPRK